MNRFNSIFNKNEIENKLKDFKEGKDYSVSPTDEPNIKTYNFHNDKLRSVFRNDRVPVRITQEAYDGKDYTYRGHFEEGKDYRYSSQHWHFSGNYPTDPDGWKKISEWREEFGDSGDYIVGGIRGRKLGNEFEPKKIDGHSHTLNNKISWQPDWIKCICGETFNKNTDSWGVEHILDGSGFTPTCCSDCAKKYADKIGGKWGRRSEFNRSDYTNSDLHKENQELRKELSEVKNQLAQVLDELKKLKRNINGKGSEKLEQQIVQNEKLIKEGENISVAEVQEQVNKSQALMNEFNTAVSSTKDNKGNDSLPYVIGGSVILVSAGIIGYLLLKKNKRK